MCLQVSPPAYGLSSHSPDIVVCRAKVFNFSEIQLINYLFHRSCLWVVFKKLSSYPRSSRFSLKLLSRCSIILHFTFRSMIHFKLTFIRGVSSVSSFIFLHINAQSFQHHLLKRLSLLQCIALAPCQGSVDCFNTSLFLGSQFCPWIYSFTETTLS